jgi:hypothetical protein
MNTDRVRKRRCRSTAAGTQVHAVDWQWRHARPVHGPRDNMSRIVLHTYSTCDLSRQTPLGKLMALSPIRFATG